MKNFSSKLILSSILVFMLFSSCKKNKDESYFVKFKLNGNWITWTEGISELGPDLLDNTKTNFYVASASKDQSQTFTIDLQVDGASINTGSYDPDDHLILVSYTTGMNTQNYKDYGLDQADNMPAPAFQLTLSSITDESIRGSFTGNYLTELFSGETVTLTEGEFYVPRYR
jgi:hypothetical protein